MDRLLINRFPKTKIIKIARSSSVGLLMVVSFSVAMTSLLLSPIPSIAAQTYAPHSMSGDVKIVAGDVNETGQLQAGDCKLIDEDSLTVADGKAMLGAVNVLLTLLGGKYVIVYNVLDSGDGTSIITACVYGPGPNGRSRFIGDVKYLGPFKNK